jgi:hypothetical protein
MPPQKVLNQTLLRASNAPEADPTVLSSAEAEESAPADPAPAGDVAGSEAVAALLSDALVIALEDAGLGLVILAGAAADDATAADVVVAAGVGVPAFELHPAKATAAPASAATTVLRFILIPSPGRRERRQVRGTRNP